MSLRNDPKIRLAKRVLFGKKDPSWLLKWSCVVALIWSLLMVLFMTGMGVFGIVSDPVSSAHEGVKLLKEIGYRFFFAYAALHVVCIFGVMLMWRLKKTGFILYVLGVAGCVFLPFYMITTLDFPYTVAVFGAISIGLFAIHWNKFGQQEVIVVQNVPKKTLRKQQAKQDQSEVSNY